jgi:UDP:flavonoid glycosyltransferase YjiC (YdhE family)
VRIMATSCPNHGHFYPMVPLLWALRGAGHDVLVAMPGKFADVAAAAGLPATSLGDDIYIGDLGRHRDNPATQGASTDDLIEHVLEYYVPLTHRVVARTVEIAESWRPDLIVHPSWEYAAPIAAARLGVPALYHSWGLTPPQELDRPIADALTPLHRRWDLPDGVPGSWQWIDVCPPSLASHASSTDALPMTYMPYNGSGVVPPWLLERSAGARICVTLGNIPIMGQHTNVLASVLAALRQVDAEIVIAASDNLEHLGELPKLSKLVRGLPLSQLLPSCDVVVHHGGSGSAMTAIVNGLPQLVLPQMCVQYQHAERIAEVGAGLRLHPLEATVDSILAAITSLLTDPAPRAAAKRLQAETTARPRPAQIANLLESAVEMRETVNA